MIANMLNLSGEIVMEILSRLPVKSLLRFRCVSKDWRNLIDDTHFITHHFNHSVENNFGLFSFDFNSNCLTVHYELSNNRGKYQFRPIGDISFTSIDVVGSCNGLVCLCFSEDGWNYRVYLCIWNPAIREIMYVLDAPIDNSWKNVTVNRGFGFDPINNDYKVVRIVYNYGKQDELLTEAKVYSLSTGEWRDLGQVSFTIVDWGMRTAFVNGSVHWNAISHLNKKIKSDEFIISFDMVLEKFREIPEHDYYGGGKDKLSFKSLGTLGGYLSVVDDYKEYLEIWVMKDYGVKQSWIKLATIQDPLIVFPMSHPLESISGRIAYLIESWRNGEVLLEYFSHSKVVSYDPKSGTKRNIALSGDRLCYFDLVPYVESLVPLGACKGAKKKQYSGKGKINWTFEAFNSFSLSYE